MNGAGPMFLWWGTRKRVKPVENGRKERAASVEAELAALTRKLGR
jgi:hypothetical protein